MSSDDGENSSVSSAYWYIAESVVAVEVEVDCAAAYAPSIDDEDEWYSGSGGAVNSSVEVTAGAADSVMDYSTPKGSDEVG